MYMYSRTSRGELGLAAPLSRSGTTGKGAAKSGIKRPAFVREGAVLHRIGTGIIFPENIFGVSLTVLLRICF